MPSRHGVAARGGLFVVVRARLGQDRLHLGHREHRQEAREQQEQREEHAAAGDEGRDGWS